MRTLKISVGLAAMEGVPAGGGARPSRVAGDSDSRIHVTVRWVVASKVHSSRALGEALPYAARWINEMVASHLKIPPTGATTTSIATGTSLLPRFPRCLTR